MLKLHEYQENVVARVQREHRLAIFADPGLGKTAMMLESARRLIADVDISRMLVVAPLRPCYTVWPKEGKKWAPELRIHVLHDKGRRAQALHPASKHQVIVVNPEGLPWLSDQKWIHPPEMLVIDESTKFKNYKSERSKALRRLTKKCGFPRRYLLTGTPSPNGVEDLHGQFLALDDGARLGETKGEFRQNYCVPVPKGEHWGWEGRKNIESLVASKIQDITIRLSARDHLDLPALVLVDVDVQMPEKAVSLYEELEAELVLQFARGDVTAVNAGALTSKLRQIASGSVYTKDDLNRRDVEVIHEAKVEALVDLVEELGGEPLMVAYAHEHDVRAIQKALGPCPRIGGGVSPAEGARAEERWNRGEIKILLVHPASGGHGLNLQEGGGHVAWYSLPWDLELYDQLNARLFRQGQERARVVLHHLIAEGTIDETMAHLLRQKDKSQKALLKALQRRADNVGLLGHAISDAFDLLGI